MWWRCKSSVVTQEVINASLLQLLQLQHICIWPVTLKMVVQNLYRTRIPLAPESSVSLVHFLVRVHLRARVRHTVVGDAHRDHSDICDRAPLEEPRDMSQPLATVARLA